MSAKYGSSVEQAIAYFAIMCLVCIGVLAVTGTAYLVFLVASNMRAW